MSLIIFKPATVVVQAGKTFILPVVIDPGTETQYTVRFTVAYPSDMLAVDSFTFSSAWLPVAQPGYDLINNKRGELIKTAGFPTGFSSAVPFGTVTFRAKQAGEAVITVGPRSFVLDAESKSTLQSRPRVSVLITEKASVTSTPGTATPTEPFLLEPLPNLPVGEQNLFDVSVGAAPAKPVNLMPWLLLILIFSIVCGVIVVRFIERLKRRRILARNKMKSSQDEKLLKK